MLQLDRECSYNSLNIQVFRIFWYSKIQIVLLNIVNMSTLEYNWQLMEDIQLPSVCLDHVDEKS